MGATLAPYYSAGCCTTPLTSGSGGASLNNGAGTNNGSGNLGSSSSNNNNNNNLNFNFNLQNLNESTNATINSLNSISSLMDVATSAATTDMSAAANHLLPLIGSGSGSTSSSIRSMDLKNGLAAMDDDVK